MPEAIPRRLSGKGGPADRNLASLTKERRKGSWERKSGAPEKTEEQMQIEESPVIRTTKGLSEGADRTGEPERREENLLELDFS